MQSITVTFVDSNAVDQDNINTTPVNASTTKARKGSRSSSRHSWVRGSSRNSSCSNKSSARKSKNCVIYPKDFNFLSVTKRNLRDNFTTPQCVSPSLNVRLEKKLQAPRKGGDSPISEGAEHAEHEQQAISVRKFMLGAASLSSDSSDGQRSTKNSSEQNDQIAAQDAADA